MIREFFSVFCDIIERTPVSVFFMTFDQDRDRLIYQYLFYCFAIVYKDPCSTDEQNNINFSQTGRRFGDIATNPTDYAQRIYGTIKEQKYKAERATARKLTTGELVKLLSSLSKGLQNSLAKSSNPLELPKILKTEDIITAFRMLTQLSPEEKQALGLNNITAEILLQQVLLNIGVYHNNQISQEAILKLYKASIGLGDQPLTLPEQVLETDEQVNKLIEETARELLKYIPSDWQNKESKTQELIRSVKQAIENIRSLGGLKEAQSFNGFNRDKLSEKYLSYHFVKTITRSVINNELLNNDFSIHIKGMTLGILPPLPLYSQQGDREFGKTFLNADILQLKQDSQNHIDNIDNTGIESNYAYQVIIDFYIRPPQEYKCQFEDSYKRLTRDRRKHLSFTVISSGVGGKLSQTIKAINRALLWDVECLRNEYFPIGNNLVINQEIINNTIASPLWSHTLVRLCKLETIKKALIGNKDQGFLSYHDVCFLDPVGRGDYCGFDIIDSAANSALQARLDAIKKTGINPNKYLQDLCYKVERIDQLNNAKKYLRFYPFSLRAMVSYLENGLLKDIELKADELSSDLPSLTHYDAYLLIIEAYLTEGLHRKAYKLLKQIKKFLDPASQQAENLLKKKNINLESSDNFKLFSSSLLAKYELCWSNYYYLCDQDDFRTNYQSKDLPNNQRQTYVNFCWQALEKAENHLNLHLASYFVINEIAQSIFYPYFLLKSNIDFLKAKLYLFFPAEVTTLISQGDPLKNYSDGRLYYLEKARINAARNGNTELYACYSAYQTVAYLMKAYLSPEDKEDCLGWAETILFHALECYLETGRKCYYKIKENSGLAGKAQPFGKVTIDNISLIKEERPSKGNPKVTIGYNTKNETLHLDMEFLCVSNFHRDENEVSEHIYLFGTNAAILQFARGMYVLCNNKWNRKATLNLEDWQAKTLRAYGLFSYAWGMATDGCKTEITEDGYYKITRNFNIQQQTQDYHSPEVDSVKDLYPHRITEIADLGKVFAAACRLLLMYLDPEQQETHRDDILALVAHFHDPTHCGEQIPDLENQPRYNGHLETYLQRVKHLFTRELDNFTPSKQSDISIIMATRDRIVRALFDSFYREL